MIAGLRHRLARERAAFQGRVADLETQLAGRVAGVGAPGAGGPHEPVLTIRRARRAPLEEERPPLETGLAPPGDEPPPLDDDPDGVQERLGTALDGLRERIARLEAEADHELAAARIDHGSPEDAAGDRPPVEPAAPAPEAQEHPALPRPPAAAPHGGAWVADALVRLAAVDPSAAGALAAAFLPVQARAAGLTLAGGLVLEGAGAFEVAASPRGAVGRPLPAGARPDGADFVLSAPPEALVALLTGHRRLRGRPRVSVTGSRRRARRLRGLAARPDVGPGDLVRHGIVPDPAALYAALAQRVAPAWTSGHAFAVAHELTDRPEERFAVLTGGEGLTVGAVPASPDAVVRAGAGALATLLGGDAPPPGGVAVRGDLDAVRLLRRWIDRARGGDPRT